MSCVDLRYDTEGLTKLLPLSFIHSAQINMVAFFSLPSVTIYNTGLPRSGKSRGNTKSEEKSGNLS